MEVWCFHERETVQPKTARTPRCRYNWGCDEKRQTEVAGHVERKGIADCVKACASLVVEGTDEEDLAEHCVYGPDCVKACASLVVQGTDEEDLAEHCVYGPDCVKACASFHGAGDG